MTHKTAFKSWQQELHHSRPTSSAACYIFESIEEVQQIATEWLWSDTHKRPNTGNGGMTPTQKLRMAA